MKRGCRRRAEKECPNNMRTYRRQEMVEGDERNEHQKKEACSPPQFSPTQETLSTLPPSTLLFPSLQFTIITLSKWALSANFNTVMRYFPDLFSSASQPFLIFFLQSRIFPSGKNPLLANMHNTPIKSQFISIIEENVATILRPRKRGGCGA